MKYIILHSLICLCYTIAQAIPNHNSSTTATANKMLSSHATLLFIENKGQITDQNHNTRPDIDFSVMAAPGLNVFIGSGEIHYQFSTCKNTSPLPPSKGEFFQRHALTDSLSGNSPSGYSPFEGGRGMSTHDTFTLYRMDVTLIGANKNAQLITEEKQDYYENHIHSTNSPFEGGKGDVSHAYTRITYKDIYPHLDWVLYIKDGHLEHEFVVQEGGNSADIKLQYGGATNLEMNTDGSLTATTPQGAITEQAPTSYQADGTLVKTNFILTGDVLTYQTGSYYGV